VGHNTAARRVGGPRQAGTEKGQLQGLEGDRQGEKRWTITGTTTNGADSLIGTRLRRGTQVDVGSGKKIQRGARAKGKPGGARKRDNEGHPVSGG